MRATPRSEVDLDRARALAGWAAKRWGIEPDEALGDVLEAAAAGASSTTWPLRALDGHRRRSKATGWRRGPGQIAHVCSLDALLSQHGGDGRQVTLLDLLPSAGPEPGGDDDDSLDRVIELLPRLTRAERRSIEGTWLAGRTSAHLAAQLGVSEAAVSLSRRSAVRKLRTLLGVR